MLRTLGQTLNSAWVWASAGLLAAQVALLVAMGRPLICPCGEVKLWGAGGKNGQSSQHIADWYTYSHVLHGVLFYAGFWLLAKYSRWDIPMRWRFVGAILLEVAWEILENTPMVIERYRNATAAVEYRGDTIVNSGFDTIWMALGFALALKVPVRWVVAMGVLMEVVCLVVIRDNLILNILTFLWPIDALVDWQARARGNAHGFTKRGTAALPLSRKQGRARFMMQA